MQKQIRIQDKIQNQINIDITTTKNKTKKKEKEKQTLAFISLIALYGTISK